MKSEGIDFVFLLLAQLITNHQDEYKRKTEKQDK